MQSRGQLLLATLLLGWSMMVSAARLLDAAFQDVHAQKAREIAAALGVGNELRQVNAQSDGLGMSHGYFEQYYKGVKVFGGSLITHLDKDGNATPASDVTCKDIAINTVPLLNKRQAIAAATASLTNKDFTTANTKAQLVIYPVRELVQARPGTDATAYDYRVVQYHLAYVVSHDTVPPAPIASRVTIIDAQSGALIKQRDDTHTSTAAYRLRR